MIRQGSILVFGAWQASNDIRFKVMRFDASTDLYHLQSTRALNDSTIERSVLHAWLRRKALVIEKRGGPN